MSESVEQVGAPPVLEVEDLHKTYRRRRTGWR